MKVKTLEDLEIWTFQTKKCNDKELGHWAAPVVVIDDFYSPQVLHTAVCSHLKWNISSEILASFLMRG